MPQRSPSIPSYGPCCRPNPGASEGATTVRGRALLGARRRTRCTMPLEQSQALRRGGLGEASWGEAASRNGGGEGGGGRSEGLRRRRREEGRRSKVRGLEVAGCRWVLWFSCSERR